MPFDRPTLEELDSGLRADITSRLPGTDPLLRRSYIGSITRGVAGGNHELFGFLSWIADQAFPDRAQEAELLRWAAIWGVTPVAAARGTGTLTVTGTASTVILSGTVWRSGIAIDYRSTAEVTIPAGGTVTVDIEAVEAGAAGNAAAGVRVSLVSPIAGVVSQAAVATALTEGADVESTDSVRARLLLRIQNPPRGGTVEDYEFWALSGHPDVTRSWARALAGGLGTVTVYFMTDDVTMNGIPTGAVVTTVEEYIAARSPVTADVTVSAPTAVELDITINNATPMTQAVQDAIEAELADLIRRETEPGGTLLISHIREAISTSAGETDHELTLPTADVDTQASQITTLGTVTFTTS